MNRQEVARVRENHCWIVKTILHHILHCSHTQHGHDKVLVRHRSYQLPHTEVDDNHEVCQGA